jgi:hypothetical protein
MTKLMKIEEEIYTHEYLWRSSTALMELARSDKGGYKFLLPSLLMSFLAYEAFLNFLGHVLAPELWAEEKKNFQGKGLEGKLGKIVEKLPTFPWHKGSNPYQSVKRLEKFRDMVAHGKVIASSYVTPQKDDGTHFTFQHAWDDYLTFSYLVSARNDIVVFSQSLIQAARGVSDDPHLDFDAYDGSLASGSGSSVRG